jgi:uncharacterized glyoxalase superfamily protein PhnB
MSTSGALDRYLDTAMHAATPTLAADVGPARGFCPGLVTRRFYETWDFYHETLGFRTVCEWDHFVHLRHSSGAEIQILREEQDGQPAELISATDGRGFWLSLGVGDVAGEFGRLLQAGADLTTALEDKPWGARQFTVRDPNGVLVVISQHLRDQPAMACAGLAVAG